MQKQTSHDPEYLAYTDGGCARNPGGPGGIGVVVINTLTGELQEVSRGYQASTNNRMEIRAVIEALSHIPDGASVALFSDSQYTLRCMNGEWAREKNLDLWKKLDPLAKGKRISFHWVRGHNGNTYNERCDRLATMGIQSANKVEDEGYVPDRPVRESSTCPREARPVIAPGGAMGVPIRIPEELQDKAPEVWQPDTYAARYNVSRDCAKAIILFYQARGNRKFKDYVQLKTGGLDAYSSRDPRQIAREKSRNPNLCIQTVQRYLHGRQADSALRWYGRGLRLEDAIRKALVDAEVRANCR